jgi:hypothetical protein
MRVSHSFPIFRPQVDELLVVLLDHTNREVVYTACGILMNMAADPKFRRVISSKAGVDSLMEVGHGSSLAFTPKIISPPPPPPQ